MVAPRKTRRIVCTVIRIPEDSLMDSAVNSATPTNRIAEQRPSDLLPWADPYISGLVARLQNEVRAERYKPNTPTLKPIRPTAGNCSVAELEPATPTFDSEWERYDEPRWNWDDRNTESRN